MPELSLLSLSWKPRPVVDQNILTNFKIESYIEPINNLTNMMIIKNILLLSMAVTVSGKIDSSLTFFEFVCVYWIYEDYHFIGSLCTNFI